MPIPVSFALSVPAWLPRAWLPWLGMGFGAMVLGLWGLVVAQGEARIILVSIGLTLFAAALLRLGMEAWRSAHRGWVARQLRALLAADLSACIATDAEGGVIFANLIGERRLDGARSLTTMLEGMFAHPGAVLYRMQSAAEAGRPAREQLATHQGLFHLSVFRVAPGLYLWRLEEQQERAFPARGMEGISLPMLVCSESGAVLFANEALRRMIGSRPRRLDRVILDDPVPSGSEVTIPGAAGLVRATVLELQGGAGRREIYLLPVTPRSAPTADEDMEHFPVAVMQLDAEGYVQTANREARALFGPQAGPGLHLSDLVEGLGRSVREWITDISAGRLPGRPEILRLKASIAEEAFVQIAVRRLGRRGQEGLVAIISDATALKTLEAQFVQSQKMQAIGQLAGGVAHDFNNLLTAISGHCDLLLLRQGPTDPDYEDLAQIRQNANRAAGLVRQLLAFSRKQTLHNEVVPVNDVLSEVTHLLRRLVGEQIRLSLEIAEEAGAIRADRRQLEQVLINLAVNARDAMPQGGEIHISTAARHLDSELPIGRALLPAGDYAVIKIRDTGQGIKPEHLGKIFEPFFTTKRQGEGTGLGLPTVYGIVKQSGGFIFCESELGQGCEFSLYFPQHTGPVPEAAPVLVPAPLALAEGTVLLVEDEAPVRAFAARALRLRGHSVVEADHGEAALDLLRDPALAVDVVVSDVILPGLDGPEWVRQALELRPDLRVIFVSGYAEENFVDRQAQIPHSVFLPKPFSLEELIRTVQSQLPPKPVEAVKPMTEPEPASRAAGMIAP